MSVPIEPIGSSPLRAIGLEDQLEVFLGVAEGLLALQQGDMIGLEEVERLRQIVEVDPVGHDPVAIGLSPADIGLELLVVDDAALVHVDQEHLARLQTPLLDGSLPAEMGARRLRRP
ncbi:MAG: hypothetical protein MPW14_23780 [Candidatus Manganitrophus sp.]|nr:MAG: hypothetical protein MPW14_23780 [Candidatus Manganitrophus sp.]